MNTPPSRWVVLALSIAWVSMAYAGTTTAPKPQAQPGVPASPPVETSVLPQDPPVVPSMASSNLTDTESMMRTAGQAVALGTTAVGLAVGGAAIIMKENPQLKAHIKKVLNRGEKNIQKDKVFTGDVESWKAYPLHEIDEKGLIPPNSTVQIGPQAAHYNAVALINASTIKRSTGYTEVHINAIEGALTALRIADDSSDNPKYYKDAMERLARRVPPGPAREFVNNHLKLHKIGTEEPKAGKI